MTRIAHAVHRQFEIEWRDLVSMRVRDGLAECCNPLPWLGLSWGCAFFALWLPAIIASFLFFLTALRLNHEAIHGNLGFRPRGDRIVLHALSAMMLGSNSAVAFNHLRHHRHLGTEADLEGAAGRMRLLEVLIYGPVFPLAMHRAAWRDGHPALRRRMRIDATLNLVAIALALTSGIGFLRYHLAAMLAAQCLTAFFAVWTTHHDCDDQIARTQRAPLLNWMTYNMFLHLEHHLYPGVPVRRLGIVSARMTASSGKGNIRLVVPEPRMVAWRRAEV